ncbi:hypothetical protein AMAG_18375 [Allomyces macrogynus ATCC 38327]|uniref:Uncharacterized protein n=1 Tax=Allomyces macrogynus (strain ATCC 38327) TaxID=578462 RepID=A0A0L0S6H9_ALLM3|nr:hypothetical protein AMAG_18375 [Allomyces macrogynus ATCC 38327]|eukprot:KNE58117.1 hypothetical protein AMAG_18375 [Allomyces macrogynus ATCC 38327]
MRVTTARRTFRHVLGCRPFGLAARQVREHDQVVREVIQHRRATTLHVARVSRGGRRHVRELQPAQRRRVLGVAARAVVGGHFFEQRCKRRGTPPTSVRDEGLGRRPRQRGTASVRVARQLSAGGWGHDHVPQNVFEVRAHGGFVVGRIVGGRGRVARKEERRQRHRVVGVGREEFGCRGDGTAGVTHLLLVGFPKPAAHRVRGLRFVREHCSEPLKFSSTRGRRPDDLGAAVVVALVVGQVPRGQRLGAATVPRKRAARARMVAVELRDLEGDPRTDRERATGGVVARRREGGQVKRFGLRASVLGPAVGQVLVVENRVAQWRAHGRRVGPPVLQARPERVAKR